MEQEQFLPRSQRPSLEIEWASLDGRLDLSTIFGNDHPVELEIGIGKGRFLMNAAKSNPERNYLGIDYARKYLMMAVDRIEKRGLVNVRLLNGEAMTLLADHLADGCLAAVHLYFPDPWPKKRHNKRRIFQQPFLSQVHRLLVPEGILYVATDHADYWEWMQEHLVQQTLLHKIDLLPEPPVDEDDGLTNYEIKYKAEGRPIYKVCYQK